MKIQTRRCAGDAFFAFALMTDSNCSSRDFCTFVSIFHSLLERAGLIEFGFWTRGKAVGPGRRIFAVPDLQGAVRYCDAAVAALEQSKKHVRAARRRRGFQ